MYIEGDVPYVTNGSNNNGWGNDWSWIIGLALVGALFGGFGRGGNGIFGGGNGGSGSEFVGYQLGRTATSEDIASGFAQNTLQRGIDDIILGQAQMQNFINQGFSGINTQLLNGFHGVDNAICNLGYQTQSGFNSVSNQIASCCCDLKGAIADVKYADERNTCNIINAINAGNQRLVDIYTNDKISALTAENASLKGKISDDYQADRIISSLAPKAPIPAYPVFPTTSFAYPSGVTFGVGNNNGCCGCNA